MTRPVVTGEIAVGRRVHEVAEASFVRDAAREVARRAQHEAPGHLVVEARAVDRALGHDAGDDALGADAAEGRVVLHVDRVSPEALGRDRDDDGHVGAHREAERVDGDALVVRLPREELVGRHVDRLAVEIDAHAVARGEDRD